MAGLLKLPILLVGFIIVVGYAQDLRKELFKLPNANGDEFGSVLMSVENKLRGVLANSPNGPFRINYFGNYRRVFIYFNGVIGLNTNPNPDSDLQDNCQVPPSKQINFIAPFWRKFMNGKVYGRYLSSVELEDSKATDPDLLEDVSLAKPTPTSFKDGYIVTWFDMHSKDATYVQDNEHTFQAVLINTNEGTFVKFFYNTLTSNGFYIRDGDENCKLNAVIGISSRMQSKSNFDFSDFHNQPLAIECLSNEPLFTRLGSYTFDLRKKRNSADQKQNPIPEMECGRNSRDIVKRSDDFHVICSFKAIANAEANRGEEGETGPTGATRPTMSRVNTTTSTITTRDPKGNTSTTTVAPNPENVLQMIADKYCSSRKAGLYQMPLVCEVFITCSLGRKALFTLCPNGLIFNPFISVCDHNTTYECNASPLLKGLFFDTASTKAPTHNNTCLYQNPGDYIDPLSCDHFYSCTNQRSIRMPCPAGLFFQVKKEGSGYCDYPRNVNCRGDGDRSIQPTTRPYKHH